MQKMQHMRFPQWSPGCVVLLMAYVTLVVNAIEDPETCENDNIMGALGKGVIASDNFYFDYRNSSTSSTPRRCVHRIYMNYKDSSKGRTICFNFRRFHLEYSEGCFNDYLQFPDNLNYEEYPDNKRDVIKYCGNGTWNRGNEVLIISNTFSPQFCWPAESSTFDIIFQADTHISGRGYFAEFEIYDTPPEETDVSLDDRPSEMCDFDPTDCTQYCYHGHKEISGCRICNCTEGATAPCFPEKYTCFNRKCVRLEDVCYGEDDCGDGSDEDFLHARCPGTEGLEACHFDHPSAWCQYKVESGWFRDNTSPYGPRYDHTYGILTMGHFMYTEAYVDGQAILSYTSDISRDSPHCYAFWYFMNGHVGSLSLEISRTQDSKQQTIQLWRREGHHDAKWLRAEIDFPVHIFPLEKIILHANDTHGTKNNIAIDDLTFAEGECWGGDLSCLFEVGFCKWRNDLDRGQMPWVRHSGAIKPKGTGPGGGMTGYYLYLNSSLAQSGSQAVLISQPVSNGGSSAWHCLSFYYHMYGPGMGMLNVSALLNDNTTVKHLWYTSTSQGNMWHDAVMLFNGIQGPFQFLVTGTVEQPGSLDFALDDIVYMSDRCPSKTDPPVDRPTTKTTYTPAAPTCAPGEWICKDGTCVREEWVCDGRFDCGDHSDEMNCSGNINLSVGTIVGISIALVFLLLVVGLAVFLVHRRQKFAHPSTASESHFDLTMPQVHPGDQPPPYIAAIDNPAYSGPSTQLPSYSTVSKKLPPYSPNVDTSTSHKQESWKAKQDNTSLVGFGALGSPVRVMAGRSSRPISIVHPTPRVSSQSTYPHETSSAYRVPSMAHENSRSSSVQYSQEPPPAYGETPC